MKEGQPVSVVEGKLEHPERAKDNKIITFLVLGMLIIVGAMWLFSTVQNIIDDHKPTTKAANTVLTKVTAVNEFEGSFHYGSNRSVKMLVIDGKESLVTEGIAYKDEAYKGREEPLIVTEACGSEPKNADKPYYSVMSEYVAEHCDVEITYYTGG